MANVPGGQAQWPVAHTAGGMHSLIDEHGDESGFEWATQSRVKYKEVWAPVGLLTLPALFVRVRTGR